MWTDYLWMLPLLGLSFGSSGGGSQETSKSSSEQGLLPAQSADLSKYVGPGLQSLYGYATNKLYGSTTPGYTQILSPAVAGTPGGPTGKYLNASTGMPVSPQDQAFYDSNPDELQNRITSGMIVPENAPGTGGTAAVTRDVPATYTAPDNFQLPGLDANGLYGGQTSAVDELLNRAYGQVGAGTPAAGAGAGVLESVLPSLINTIGSQTTGATQIPEQVRQQRVQNVNAVLQLMSAGLGGSSAGSSFKTFSSSNIGGGFNIPVLQKSAAPTNSAATYQGSGW